MSSLPLQAAYDLRFDEQVERVIDRSDRYTLRGTHADQLLRGEGLMEEAHLLKHHIAHG
jgi:hypothetical protein